MTHRSQVDDAPRAGLALWIGLPLTMFLCCGLPALLGAGGIALMDGFLLRERDPLIAGAVLLVALVAGAIVWRRRRRSAACCVTAQEMSETVSGRDSR